MLRFLKITLLGGILFLVPIIIFFVIIGKALQITNKLAVPMAGSLGFDSIGGIAATQLLAVIILLLICFLAGLAAKSPRAKKLAQSLEINVLEKIPAYEIMKVKTQSLLNPGNGEGTSPVMARFDDSWQLAFEIERIEGDNVVLFLPGSPEPWSGSVCIMAAERITPLDLTVKSAADLMKRLGKGSAHALSIPQGSGNASI